MFHIFLAIHCTLCILLVILVLLQQGKGADMGAAMGGSSSTVFGAGGATDFFTKFTSGVALAFMFTSIMLVNQYAKFYSTSQSIANPLEGSVMQGVEAPAPAKVDEPPSNAPAANTNPETKTEPAAAAPAVAVEPAKEVKPETAPKAEQKSAEVNVSDVEKGAAAKDTKK